MTELIEQDETTEGGQSMDTPEGTHSASAPEDEQGVNFNPEIEEDEPDTFPREYVVKLRDEAAAARIKAKQADDYAQRLHVAQVAALGRLEDPGDLPYAEDLLDDPEALQQAVEDLLARKPHLASRRVRGDIGQGALSSESSTVDLAGLLRARA